MDPRERPNPEMWLPVDQQAGADPFANKPLEIILTFEGGGAKGIVHLGAYREIERAMDPNRGIKYDHWPKYALRGLSGTSIGALVAALISVEYSSEEMLPKEEAIPPTIPRPPARSRRFARVLPWLIWGARSFIHSFAMKLLSWARQTAAARSKVLENARLNKVTSVFGTGVLRFLFLRSLVSHPLLMSVSLALIWLLSILGIHWALINGYPFLHQWWVSWGFADQLPNWLGSMISWFLQSLADYAPTLSLILFWLLSVFVFAWAVRCLLRGLLTTDIFTNAIDLALAVKLKEKFEKLASDKTLEQSKRVKFTERLDECASAIKRRKAYRKIVTFQMLRDADCKSLAMVATNIRSGALELFSNDATPNVFVADAVAASAAIPILFRPVKIDGDDDRVYYDGGFTSNLPAWPYDAQREINPDLHTFTIEVRGKVPYRAWTSWRLFKPFSDFMALVAAAVFGARALETRRTRRVPVELDTEARLMDFDMGTKRANDEIEWARRGFRASLNLRAAKRKLYADKCLRIFHAVRKHLASEPPSGIKPRIRVSLLQPTRYGARALRQVWRFCSNCSFRLDTDDRLLFRKGTSVPGKAWESWLPVLRKVSRDPFEVIWNDPNRLDADAGSRHRYSHRLLWDEIEWMLAVPVMRSPGGARGSTDWVVVVDSNIPLDNFEFCDGRGRAYHDIHTAIHTIASELWQLDDEAKVIAERLDQEMIHAA
jgi:predicted acylesterase/phospholipase RssA